MEFRDAGKSSRILLYHSINVKDRANWSEAADWMYQEALIFKKTVKEIDKYSSLSPSLKVARLRTTIYGPF